MVRKRSLIFVLLSIVIALFATVGFIITIQARGNELDPNEFHGLIASKNLNNNYPIQKNSLYNYQNNSSLTTSADSSTWIQINTNTSPLERVYHAMTYDSLRGHVVLFGGQNDTKWFSDTWEFDGNQWQQLLPALSPSARGAHAISFDSKRGVTVLAGGFDGIGWPGDTWEWNGIDWLQRKPAASSPGPTGSAMAYDSKRGVLVMFGGFGANFFNDTWEWDGINWVTRTPTTKPPARAHLAIAYDSKRGRTVIFGGYNNNGPLNGTWEWDGNNWIQFHPLQSPSARNHSSMAFDSTRNRIVLFGGIDLTGALNDTWEWDGANWQRIFPNSVPTARWIHTIAYDESNKYILLFGGSGTNSTLNDTWKYITLHTEVSPPSHLISIGKVVSYTLSIEGTPSQVTLTHSILPEGMQGRFYPSAIITTSAQSTFVITTTEIPNKDYSILIIASTTDLSTTIPITLSVINPDFGLVIAHTGSPIYPGQTANYTLNLTSTATLTGSVSLGVIGLPAGLKTSINPNPALPNSSAVISLKSTSFTQPGTYSFEIVGSAIITNDLGTQTITHSVESNLTILPADFSITITPNTRTIYVGNKTTYTIDIDATPGFTIPVSLNAVALPFGVNYSFSPMMVSPGATSSLIITATQASRPGSYQFTISGTALSISKTKYVGLNLHSIAYFPIIVNHWPPIPYQPNLTDIQDPEDGEYLISWAELPQRLADFYTVQEATDSKFTTGLKDICITDLQYCYISLRPPGTYYYRVNGTNGWGTGDWSNIQSTIVPPLAVPTLYPINNSDQNIKYSVSWSNVNYATGYRLQEATDPGFTQVVQVYDDTALLWTTPDPGKMPGTYYYRVQSYNSVGSSDWSNPTAVTVYPLTVPTLFLIDNSDQDNKYFVSWSNVKYASAYHLQEATDPGFVNVIQVYDGTALLWTTPNPGKFPGTYYYRVQSYNGLGSSSWSTSQKLTVYPLFVGLNLRWDGNGYIRGYDYYDIGTHETDNLDALTEPDTIRLNGHLWYDPNPIGFEDGYWTSYYSILTGLWKGSSVPGDPSWKWGDPSFLPYTLQLSNNKTVSIDNQPFTATGPYTGVTSWGHTIQYWQLVNQKKFVYWSDGGDWIQYVHVGEAILRYDAGSSRLLLYDNIKRRYYYKGKLTQDSVQYITNLTSSTSIPGSPTSSAFPEPASSGQDSIIQTLRHPFESLKPSRP